ncbi:helix-turn-helix transcriptional regulator [Sporosarcina sp. Te-1]|uniref:ArsR/SmtB family transcription factor n=1 Tax=Sporosarcina sp. Te-1 TaxID=2818390 RepID=UPI001A9E2424|nr:helix-turn-helix domain-containing protein [Sporosarcina sp. Te-1]QTD40102.1 helix-turn-helix transcriptional regulator [Sporosarcina sp. Te-1]
MAFEKDDGMKKPVVVVDHVYSPVVEALSLLGFFVGATKNEFAEADSGKVLAELSSEAKKIIEMWPKSIALGFSPLLNFLLPCPYFHDVQAFVEGMDQLSDAEYVYNFFSEYIPLPQVEELVEAPASLPDYEETILWDTDEKREAIMEFLASLNTYRRGFSSLVVEIDASIEFQQALEAKKEMAETAMQEVQSISMEPLALAQYVMGKSFRRTSQYKMFYFIPSYYSSPGRIRLFNTEVCIVIYGCAVPLSDVIDTSKELESQLKVLADRNRLLMLRLLSGQREYGAKIAEYLGITTATVSHHLELLKKAGLVKEEKVGNIKYFSCDQEKVEQVLAEIRDFI